MRWAFIQTVWFQHTATRRWLRRKRGLALKKNEVSTHSHPKVAAKGKVVENDDPEKFQHTATRRWLPSAAMSAQAAATSFNTQPPEGGCQLLPLLV